MSCSHCVCVAGVLVHSDQIANPQKSSLRLIAESHDINAEASPLKAALRTPEKCTHFTNSVT